MPYLVRIEYWNENDGVWYTGHPAYALIDPETYINKMNARGQQMGRCLELGDDLQPTGVVFGSSDGVSFGHDMKEEEMDRKLLISLWEKLDTKLDQLMAQTHPELREPLKDSARGFSEAIQVLMSSDYPEVDDVVRESVTRYKARQSNTPHESPGLGERSRRTGLAGALRGGASSSRSQATTRPTQSSKPTIKIQPKPAVYNWGPERDMAVSMIQSGIFPNIEITTATGAPVHAVQELREQLQQS